MIGTEYWRAQAGVQLTDRATWLSVTQGTDASGNPTETVTDNGEVACRFEADAQAAATEQVIAGAVVARYRWTVWLPVSLDVTPEDRLVKAGETFDVIDSDRARTQGLLQAVTCVRHE